MNIFELVGKMTLDGQAQVNQQLGQLEKNTQKVQKGLKIMGAAFTAVGATGLAMIQSTKVINAQLGVTALNLGVTTEEMRELTLATTNVTFPIEEVTASFDLLARAGVKDQETLKATATAFDTLGDAIGLSASKVTEIMVPVMKTFRLSAEEVASKTDMMTYMVRNSTISLEDFNTMVGYTTQDMVDAGLTVEDMAAAMMYMSDQGVAPGRVMLREWNKAVTQSQEEGIALTAALGMTTGELEAYKAGLEGATGMTQEYADVANEQYTLMDKMKQKFSELTLSASGFLEPLEPILAGMTALGPLMIVLSTSAGTAAVRWGLHTAALVVHKVALIASTVAMKAVTIAQWLWNAALTANPIGLIIVAIGALIAAGVWLVQNWEKVTEFFGLSSETIIEGFAAVKTFFIETWENIKELFVKGMGGLLAIMSLPFTWPLLIAEHWDAIKEAMLKPLLAAKQTIENIVNSIKSALTSIEIPDFGGGMIGMTPGSAMGLTGYAGGGPITEPTLLYGLRSQRPYAIAGERGDEYVSPTRPGTTVTNQYNISQLVVREEADIGRIARELTRLQQLRGAYA